MAAGDLAVALQEQEGGDQRRLGEILVALGFCRSEDVAAAQQNLRHAAANSESRRFESASIYSTP